MPQATRSAFQTSPGPCRVHAPNWRKAVGLGPHIREDATRFRGEGAPRALHLPMLAEAERVETLTTLAIIVGFKPTEHATCEPLGWRRADHSKAMPHDGTHRLATACRTPPASLSKIGARLRTCTSRLPLTRRALRCQSLKGMVWCRWLDLHQLPAHYQCAAHLDVLQRRKWRPRSELNTRNPPSEGRRRNSVGVGTNWHR